MSWKLILSMDARPHEVCLGPHEKDGSFFIPYTTMPSDAMRQVAYLAAAAPDMLAVLKHVHEHGYVTLDDFDMVRDVIAKAEGRS